MLWRGGAWAWVWGRQGGAVLGSRAPAPPCQRGPEGGPGPGRLESLRQGLCPAWGCPTLPVPSGCRCPPPELHCLHALLSRGASAGPRGELGALCPGEHAGFGLAGQGPGLGCGPAPHSARQPVGAGQQAPPGLMELASISRRGGGGCNRKLPSLAAIFSTAKHGRKYLTQPHRLCPHARQPVPSSRCPAGPEQPDRLSRAPSSGALSGAE